MPIKNFIEILAEDRIEKAKEILRKIDKLKQMDKTGTKSDRRRTKSSILMDLKPQLQKLNLSKSEIDMLMSWKKKERLE